MKRWKGCQPVVALRASAFATATADKSTGKFSARSGEKLEARPGFEPGWEALHSLCVAAPPPGHRLYSTAQLLDSECGRQNLVNDNAGLVPRRGPRRERQKCHAAGIVADILAGAPGGKSGRRELVDHRRRIVAREAER